MKPIKDRVRLKELFNNQELLKLVKNKGCSVDFDKLFNQYASLKNIKEECDKLINIQKHSSKENAAVIKKDIKDFKAKMHSLEQEIFDTMNQIPNVPHITVPIGKSATDNVLIKQYSDIIHKVDHFKLQDIVHYQHACGSRFVYLQGNLPKLERALINFMLDKLTLQGFKEYSLPHILTTEAFNRTRHLPKDKNNMFSTDNNLWVAPTNEVSLMNLFYKRVIDDTMKVCSVSDCFRKEAGAAGKDTKGLVRLHQFKKCEMVIMTSKDNSYRYLEYMLEIACDMLRDLEIPHRIMLLCTGDMPFTSAKTYDIEIPIGGKWVEVSSISNCTDFQTITMETKHAPNEYAHSLNGSALAIGRTIASIIETHYTNGYIKIPSVLQKYIGDNKIFVA